MSFTIRPRKNKGGGQTNYLASVSDLMAALLLIFIIMIAVAVLQAQSASQDAMEKAKQMAEVKERLTIVEKRLAGNQQARSGMLEAMKNRMNRDYGIKVDIDAARGVLRIPETAVTFEVGSAGLDESNALRLKDIGVVLVKEVSCFEKAYFEKHETGCRKKNPNGNVLDAIFIEGHTDNQSYVGDRTDSKNRNLSTARSNAVYAHLVFPDPVLRNYRNAYGQELFSLSGYGSARPVPGHEHAKPTDDPANRRIELRFIFSEPHLSEAEKALIIAQ